MPRRPWLPFAVLAAGVLVVSLGAILVRLAQGQGVPSLAVATLRLGIAAAIVTPIAWLRSRAALAQMSPRGLLAAATAGFFLALHFATWISSLEYTSVASSTALVTTNPLWIGLASVVFFRERLKPATVAGIVLTLAGSFAIFLSDSRSAAPGARPVLGNALALAGALCFSAYLLIGRRVRAGLPLTAYIWLAYGGAALFLLLASLVSDTPLAGYSVLAYAVLLGLALGPQLLGHTAYNWSLRHVSATFVAVATLGEPVGGAVLAFFLFDEKFAPLQLLGFALLLAGIYLAARAEK
jgi:drug/metabolite transporter (DMT)-like permease